MDVDPPAGPSQSWGASSSPYPTSSEWPPSNAQHPPSATALASGSATVSTSSFIVGPPLLPPVIPTLPTAADAYAATMSASVQEQAAVPPPYQHDTSEQSQCCKD